MARTDLHLNVAFEKCNQVEGTSIERFEIRATIGPWMKSLNSTTAVASLNKLSPCNNTRARCGAQRIQPILSPFDML